MPQDWVFTYDSFLGLKAPIPLALSVGQAVTYLTLVYVIAPLLRPTTEAGKKTLVKLRFYHNVALFLFSLVSCVGAAYHIISNREFTPAMMMCRGEYPTWFEWIHYAFIVSKAWEWLDSCFLVWTSKDFSKLNFLHVYHHATTLWLFIIVANFPVAKWGVLLNGAVHTAMYAHYAWPFPKKLVPLITGAQIFQLLACFLLYTFTPAVCGGVLADFSSEHFWTYATPFTMVPTYFAFFVRYYVKRFIFGIAPRTGDRAAKKKE